MVTVPWSIGKDSLRLRAGPPRARRSLYACALLILGYAIARFLLPHVESIWFLAAAPAALAIALLSRGRVAQIAICTALLLFSAGWYHARILERPRGSIAWDFDDESESGHPILTTVRGIVTESPRPVDPPSGPFARWYRFEPAVAFTISLSAIEPEPSTTHPASGTMRIRLGGDRSAAPPALIAGSILRLTGRLAPVRPPSNPGEPDARAQAAQDNLIGTLSIPEPGLIEFLTPEATSERLLSTWYGAIGALHDRCERAIDASDASKDPRTAQARALLGALLLGQRDGPLDEVNAAFTRLGVLHLVAISGFNLAVMAGALMFALRLTGDRGWLEPLAVAILVALYMLVLPAQAPILRAGILVLVLLLTETLGRRYDRTTVLGWIALVLLVIRPLDAWSLGFQLSFGIVAALMLLGDTVHHRLWGVPLRGLAPTHQPHGRPAWWAWLPPLWRWSARSFKAQISAGLLAWAVSIPIIACHTGQFSPLAPIATLIVLPLTVIVLWGGYLALLVGVLIPPAAAVTGPVLDAIASFLVNVVMLLDRAPGTSFTLPSISPWWAIAAVAGVIYLVLRGERESRVSWAICGILSAWIALEVVALPRLANRSALRIDTLSVGDGSCHLLRSGPHAALWDCGSLTPGVGQFAIPRALRALGVWRVPTVVVTHAHLDHFAAIPDLIEPLGIRRVIVPPQLVQAATSDPASAPAVLLAELARHNVAVETHAQGDRLELAGHAADLRWPPPTQTFRDPNDHSLIAMLEIPTTDTSRRVLLTGDASREALANLLPDQGGLTPAKDAHAISLRADVLELPHHGAFIDPAVALVHLVNPSVVLQSTGPRRAADSRWAPHMDGRTRYCTPLSGAAWITIEPDGTIRAGSMR